MYSLYKEKQYTYNNIKQLNRNNRINRFGNQQPNNIIEGDAEEIKESDEEKKL